MFFGVGFFVLFFPCHLSSTEHSNVEFQFRILYAAAVIISGVNLPSLTTKPSSSLFHSFGATLFQNSGPSFLNQNFSEVGDECLFLTLSVGVTGSQLGHPDLTVTLGNALKKKVGSCLCSFTLRGCNFTKDVCLENMISTYIRNCYPWFPLGVQQADRMVAFVFTLFSCTV